MIATIRARRVQLQRPQLIILAFCAFVALVNVYFLATYLNVARERDALRPQVDAVERAVQRLQDRGATPGQVSQLQPGENPFPRDLPSAELTNLVVDSAQQANVRVESMTPQLGPNERLAQNVYRTYKLQLRLNGPPANVADFMGRLERGSVKSWVIDNIQAHPLQGNTAWDVSFDVTAYAQQA